MRSDRSAEGRYPATKEQLWGDWDASNATPWALLSSLLLVVTFFFMPWIGSSVTNNGSKIFADTLYGTVGTLQSPLIGVILLAMTVALTSALWGVFVPEHGALATLAVCAAGLGSSLYFLPTLSGSERMGLGFWLALVACAVFVLHPLVGFRAVQNRLDALRPKRRVGTRSKLGLVPYYFLLPGLIIYALWIVGPTLYTFYLSFTNWDGFSAPTFVGFENYLRLFTNDRDFTLALVNNIRWLAVFITVPTASGLGLAMVLNTEMKGGRFFKVSFYFPLVLSLPVIGLIWAWIYNPRLGLLNSLLFMLGVERPPGWLADRDLAIWAIIAAAVWRQTGYVMILYLAGLKAIDPNLVDAARVDGARRWPLFRHVLFPLLAPVTTIVAVISVIDSFRAFDLVSIMTRGRQNTQVLANYMYQQSFQNYQMGYGAAVAVVLFALSMIFVTFYLLRALRQEREEGL